MATRFLVPCSCGKGIAVDATQAGDLVTCHCGASVEVPPLRVLKALEPAEPSNERLGGNEVRAWRTIGRLAIVFSLLAAAPGLALMAARVASVSAERPTEEPVDEKMSPVESWMLWIWIDGTRLGGVPPSGQSEAVRSKAARARWVARSMGTALVGLGVAVLAWFADRRQRVAAR